MAPDSFASTKNNNLRAIPNPSTPPFFANNAPNFHASAQTSSFNRNSGSSDQPPVNNLFGSQTACYLNRRKGKRKK